MALRQENFRQLNKKGILMNESLAKENKSFSDDRLSKNNLHSKNLTNKDLEERGTALGSGEEMRRILWENTPELRQLRKMLLVADVARDQAMQMAEKRGLCELQKEEEARSASAAAAERATAESEERRREEEGAEARRRYHLELDAMRQLKKAQESSHAEQLKLEKIAIDRIQKQIVEEDFKRVREKIEKQRELRRQMTELQETREKLKLQEKFSEASQTQKVADYQLAQQLRAKEREMSRQLELEKRLRVQEEMLSSLEKESRERAQRERLRTELAVEEKELEESGKYLLDEARRREIREDLQKAYEMQLRMKEHAKDELKKEEELFRQNMMSKLYEEDKLELMGQRKRREKQLQHKQAVQAMLEQSREKRIAEKTRELAELKYLEKLEEERRLMVDEERTKFLREHSHQLLGYLPRRFQAAAGLGDQMKDLNISKIH